ncbi:hypothetical protein PoB_007679500 [Plakobranchus ocellatus]|uniref:Uncharacterized protein n=1 Tax=Plakobranchus ocellatus TaxID=259542 RepID=A0AAV4E1K6_9GAST|nr:hypothetical protein PoB_007679500 [Plakobranchus ocellatus]
MVLLCVRAGKNEFLISVIDEKTVRGWGGGVGGTVASESALRSAGTFLSRVRAPLPAPWPDGGPESLKCLAVGWLYTKINQSIQGGFRGFRMSIMYYFSARRCHIFNLKLHK